MLAVEGGGAEAFGVSVQAGRGMGEVERSPRRLVREVAPSVVSDCDAVMDALVRFDGVDSWVK